MESYLSETGQTVWNWTTETWNQIISSPRLVIVVLLFLVAWYVYPYMVGGLRYVYSMLLWLKAWRALNMGIYNNWALRCRIMDHLVDEIDKDFLAGLITHKQRQFLYKDLGTKLGLKDLLPLIHPRKQVGQMVEWRKREAKKRLGLDPDKTLAEQTAPAPAGKQRRKLKPAAATSGETCAVKIG